MLHVNGWLRMLAPPAWLLYRRSDGRSFTLIHLQLNHMAIGKGELVPKRAVGHRLADNYVDRNVISGLAGEFASHLGVSPFGGRGALDLPMLDTSIGIFSIDVPECVRIDPQN